MQLKCMASLQLTTYLQIKYILRFIVDILQYIFPILIDIEQQDVYGKHLYTKQLANVFKKFNFSFNKFPNGITYILKVNTIIIIISIKKGW